MMSNGKCHMLDWYLYIKRDKTVHFFISPKFQIPKTKSQEIQVYPSDSAFVVGTLWNLGLGIWDLGFNIKCMVLSRFKYSTYSFHHNPVILSTWHIHSH